MEDNQQLGSQITQNPLLHSLIFGGLASLATWLSRHWGIQVGDNAVLFGAAIMLLNMLTWPLGHMINSVYVWHLLPLFFRLFPTFDGEKAMRKELMRMYERALNPQQVIQAPHQPLPKDTAFQGPTGAQITWEVIAREIDERAVTSQLGSTSEGARNQINPTDADLVAGTQIKPTGNTLRTGLDELVHVNVAGAFDPTADGLDAGTIKEIADHAAAVYGTKP